MYVLHVLEGPDAGQRFPLPEREPQLIGRSTEALPISDPSVSRRHAELTPDEGKWWIRDLDSANGTFLNNQPVLDRNPVEPGDQIRCGDTVLAMVHQHEEGLDGAIRAMDPELNPIEILPVEIDSSAPSMVLATITALLAKTDDLRESLPKVTVVLCNRFDADRAAILSLNAEGSSTGIETACNPQGQTPEHPVHLPRPLLARVHDSKSPHQARTRDQDPEIIVCIPVLDREDLLGVLVLQRDQDRPWQAGDIDTLQAAGRIIGLTMGVIERSSATNRTKRLAAMGEAIAALSHSIKNILQGLRGGADAVELGLQRDDLTMARQGWPILARNLDRTLSLTMNMLAYSKERTLDMEFMPLGALAREAMELVSGKAKRLGIEIELVEDPHEPPIPLDPDAIHQALVNLVDNALEAAPADEGRVRLETRFDPDQDQAIALISDNGPGIASLARDKIFEPFSSSKGQRGTGLGLAVARKLLEQHGGAIKVVEPALGGATIMVSLPGSQPEDPDSGRTRGPKPLPNGDLGVKFSDE